jgi:CO/xanthine dehydrogenase Mo-binding subunit
MSEFSTIGKPIAMVDAAGKTTGQGKYTDDLSLAGMLVGKILHSPHPHALIKKIDATRARKLPGVIAVVTGQDAPNTYGILPIGHDEHALALDKVRYVGDNVACVAAVDEATAEKALVRPRTVDEGAERLHPRKPRAQHREGISPRIRGSGQSFRRGRLRGGGALHRQRGNARGHGTAFHAGGV